MEPELFHTRVAFCAYDRPHYLAGGPNNWAQRLLPDLRARGIDVHALVIHAGDARACPLIIALGNIGIPVKSISRDDARYVGQQARWILDQVEAIQPDVFVANLVTPAFYASRWIRSQGIPTVGVFHSSRDFCDAMTSRFIAGPKRDAFVGAVCVSNAIFAKVSRKNQNDVHIEQIPCGAPVPATKRIFAQTPAIRVLYVGRIAHQAKRAIDVAKAFCLAAGAIPGSSFTIVGAGPDEQELKDVISDAGANESVHFIGPLPPSELPAIYGRHDIIVLLSEYEGMPIAMIEGMASGLVPIALRTIEGIDELIVDGHNGLLVNDSTRDFVSALQSLSAHPDRLRKLAEGALATASSQYSSDLNHARWAEYLQRLAEKKKPRRFRAPLFILLPHPEPDFGSEDERSPSYLGRSSQFLKRTFFQIRQKARPRTRLRSIFARGHT